MTFQGASGFNPKPGGPKFGIAARRGFRGWVVPDLETGALRSTNWAYDWTPGINVSTHWPSGRSYGWIGSVPTEGGKHCEYPTTDCSCGFYAYGDEAYWWDSGYPTTKGPMVAGIIEGFGRMVVASKGFRAGKAVILALAAPVAVEQKWLDANNLTMEETSHRVRNAVQARYWNVPIYDTVPAMLAAHPLMGNPKEAA